MSRGCSSNITMFSFKSAGNAVRDFLTVFRTPRFIDVNDLRLGVSSRILQSVVLAYFLVLMISFKEYEVKYTPKGGAQYYMSSGYSLANTVSHYFKKCSIKKFRP